MYLVNKNEIACNKVPFAKGQIYEVREFKEGLNGSYGMIEYKIEIKGILKSGKVKVKNLDMGFEYKICPDKANVRRVYTLL